MTVYRFVGVESVVGKVKMQRFGQRFQLADELAKEALKGGCALLPEEQFNELGFTDEDLRVWADPMVQDNDIPPNKQDADNKAEFMRKRALAREQYCQIRHELLDVNDRPIVGGPATEEVHTPQIVEVL